METQKLFKSNQQKYKQDRKKGKILVATGRSTYKEDFGSVG